MDVHVLDGADRAGAAAADALAREVRQAVGERGVATLALSGGRTPARLFEELAKLDLPWSAVHVFQVDERLAPDGDPDRNLSLIRERLLAHVELPAANLHPMPVGVASLEAAARRYAEVLRSTCGSPPVLDAVHLGLGADGHTASLFPDDPAAEVTGADVVATGEHEGRRRLTLTRPVLDGARRRVWLVTGAERAEALRALVEGDGNGGRGGSGGSVASRLRRDGSVVFADEAAARSVPPGG